ncbi:MAG: asparagine--tRNA ligase [Candidatus Dasytiphilus stammeri]
MNRVSVIDILQGRIDINTIVTLTGWVRTRRSSKAGISFISLNDGSCLKSMQVITDESLSNYKQEILRLSTGCSVIVTGELVISPGKNQKWEIITHKIEILGWVENPETYPISSKKHSVQYLRDLLHLRPRTNFISSMIRIRHSIAQAIHTFFHKNGYWWISTPIITSADPEGIGSMFRITTLDLDHLPRNSHGNIDFRKDFFGKEIFLTGTGQLNGEAYACALKKIYTFGPTFRAENSNTSRHLSEFWMVEPEVAFATLQDIIILAEELLKSIIRTVLSEREEDINFLSSFLDVRIIPTLEKFLSNRIIRIDYTEAIKILLSSNNKFTIPVFWGIDLASEHERYLTEHYFHQPIVVINYPKDIKAFYMRINDDSKTVASMDLLVPGIGEIIGGSQREERISFLDSRLDALGLKKEDYYWYRDLRKYGTVPHSGFGLGFERLISYITGIPNIRDVIPFPRTARNARL